MFKSTLFIAALVLLALIADYLVKEASNKQNGYFSWEFAMSIPIVIVAGIGWLQAMRMETLAGIGVLEASFSVLGLMLLSILVFGETVRPATYLAAALALTAVTTQTLWG